MSKRAKNHIYTIKISDYPWTDSYAKTHSTLKATMLKEGDAKIYLDGYQIEIFDYTPLQDQYHKGDKGVTGKWVRGKLQNGPLMYSKIAVMKQWLTPAPNTYKTSDACICEMNTILAKGCQCGGI